MSRAELRATLIVLVLAVVGVIALWPREPATSPASTSSSPTATTAAPARPEAGELAALRAEAALQPCPAQAAGRPGPPGPLTGIVVPCLGQPTPVDVAAALAGRPALVNVWASWCRPCREEIPALAAYAARPDAIVVLGVNVQDREPAALSLLAELGARYPSVTDPDGALRAALRVPAILPTSVVVLADGSVRPLPPTVFRSPEQIAQVVRRYLPTN